MQAVTNNDIHYVVQPTTGVSYLIKMQYDKGGVLRVLSERSVKPLVAARNVFCPKFVLATRLILSGSDLLFGKFTALKPTETKKDRESLMNIPEVCHSLLASRC